VADDKFYKTLKRGIATLCKAFAHKIQGDVESKCQIKRCTRQFVLIAERNAKYLSSLTQADPSTAENAGRRKEVKEEDTRF
jgi:hypothetical protein